MMASSPKRPAVYVVDPYHEKAIARLEQNSDIDVVLPHDPRRSEYLQKATAILVRSETKLLAKDLEMASPELKYIIKQGVGVDNIDLDAAKGKGIRVFNTPGLNSEAVAELTIALAFCVARRISEIDRMIRSGEKVVRSRMLGKSLFGKTVGIIGMGNIGLEVAVKWHAVTGGRIVAFDPFAKDDAWVGKFGDEASFSRASELGEVLRTSDVVTIHVPLTSSTRKLISATELGLMKEGSILLNCARGGVVDEEALLHALNSGHLFGAGLDAVENEPPTVDSYGETLLSHPRVIITPHIGASTVENQEKSGLAAVQILFDLLDDTLTKKPQSLV